MELPCPYCRGTGKFRHERPPNVSDKWWFNMVGQAFRCALCKGLGKLERPTDALVLDTGLVFIKALDARVLVGCPDPTCQKWIDCTEAFKQPEHRDVTVVPQQKTAKVPVRSFVGKCPQGHDISIDITPQGGRF